MAPGQCRGREADGRKKKKLIEYADWLSGVGRDTCKDCRASYAARNKKTRWDKVAPVYKPPPCDKCRPALLEVNATAVTVYGRCSDQWRHSRATGQLVIDNINIDVVLTAMDIAGPARLEVLDDVKFIASEISALVIEDSTGK